MKLQRIIPNKNVLIIIFLLLLNVFSFLFYVAVKNSINFTFNEKYSINDKFNNDNLNNQLVKTTVSHLSNVYLNSKLNISDCPLIPKNLTGRIKVDTNSNITIEDIEKLLESLNITKGGLSSPSDCLARYNVAIIIPYRNREENLKIFLKNMHPYLKKQQLNYGIYFVEPLENLTFNRGLLMNIGFLESIKLTNSKWDCFIYHDVDLIPEDDRNIYSCPEEPRHMSSAVSTFNYRLPYDTIFGGVSALTKIQMYQINGYSNLYFGWGGEDDDFRERIVGNGLKVSRYPLDIGRYLMVKHERDQAQNPERFKLLNAAKKRMKTDGLNSIEYKVVEIIFNKLFTKILVTYDQDAILKKNY